MYKKQNLPQFYKLAQSNAFKTVLLFYFSKYDSNT